MAEKSIKSNEEESIDQHNKSPQITWGDRAWWLLNQPFWALGLLLLCMLVAFWLYRAGMLSSPSKRNGIENLLADSSPEIISVTNLKIAAASVETGDIYLVPLAQPTPVNLTHSSTYTELAPVFSPDGEHVAFFAIGPGADCSVHVWKNGQIWDVTYQGASAGLGKTFCVISVLPPRWSQDSQSLAFLAEQCDGEGKAIEVFVTSATGSSLRRISKKGNVVRDIRWVDNHTLAYIELQGDGTLILYSADTTASGAEPVELARFTH